MAKAQFQRNQRVWVASVGCWATIERVLPVWAKGFDEPVRITYDVGLGREFLAHELQGESPAAETPGDDNHWRIMRARNKWQAAEDCGHHPHPGTFPVVVTDQEDWGGWRVPGAEYDRNPDLIEMQARLIAVAPHLLSVAEELIALVSEEPENAPPAVARLARRAQLLSRHVADLPPLQSAETAEAA